MGARSALAFGVAKTQLVTHIEQFFGIGIPGRRVSWSSPERKKSGSGQGAEHKSVLKVEMGEASDM
jgi:hypothetical protein